MNETKKHSKPLHKKLAAPLAGVAVGIIVLLGFNAQLLTTRIYLWTHKPPLSSNVAAAVTPTPAKVDPAPRILIRKLGVDAPVIYNMDNTDDRSVQRSLQHGVLQFGPSALPGQKGNVVIVGHSSNVPWVPGDYKFVFTQLGDLQPGDQVILHYQSLQYIYKVMASKVVSPYDTSVLEPTDTPQLTLITCTPVGTNLNRLIVNATQVSPDPATATEGDQQSSPQRDSGQTLPGQGAGFIH